MPAIRLLGSIRMVSNPSSTVFGTLCAVCGGYKESNLGPADKS
jgi:hypothetical protein